MLNTLITSRTRIKLLLKFFINPETSGYLRQLAAEFGESTNAIRVELNKLSQAKILDSKQDGRNKIFRANVNHPLFQDIRNIVMKSTGIDKVLSNIIHKSGQIHLAFVRGDYAAGKDSGLIDLVLVGTGINMLEIERVKKKTEQLINRTISILILSPAEYENLKSNFLKHPVLILFTGENSGAVS